MPDVQPRIATRHHTHDEQIATVCRIWGKQGEALLVELDDCPRTAELKRFAAALRQAGEETPGVPEAQRLHLVR